MMETKSFPYSWGDIADTFNTARSRGEFPTSLVKSEVYWDQICLYIEQNSDRELVRGWLSTLFPLRYINDAIKLDGPSFSRSLPLEIVDYDREVAGDPPPALASQYVAASTQIWFKRTDCEEQFDQSRLPSIAFHSVKGGVGRTTSALSYTIALAEKFGLKPLLVDADFEAPGISYLFLSDGRECHFSLEDLIVLAHADPDPSAGGTIAFGAEKLANQTHDGITFLPCLRRADMLSAFAIRPEQLQRSHSDKPFFLLEILQKLAREAGCDALVLDLRAGFTDLAAMVLCAPGVAPVFVTTPSGQAVMSTMEMISFIGRETQANGGVRGRPAIVINNVIPQVRRSAEFTRITAGLEESASSFIDDPNGGAAAGDIITLTREDVSGPPIVTLDHAPALTAAPRGLKDFLDDLRGQNCFDQIAIGLADWTVDYLDSQGDGSSVSMPIIEQSAQNTVDAQPQKNRRQKLHAFARDRIFAETSQEISGEFLTVRALRELGERFRTETPNATCIGMKGAGKTFTFRVLTHMSTWGNFTKHLRMSPVGASREALIAPVLPAKNIQGMEGIGDARQEISNAIRGNVPLAFSRLNELIDQASKNLTSESEWGNFWLNVIAWSSGVSPEKQNAGEEFIQLLIKSGNRIVALFDGLEESFQSFRADPNQQAAIRGLTSSLAQRLTELPGRPLGQINFVRSDLILAAYPNNNRQFVDRNRAFALTWYDRDILELAAWFAKQAGAAETWDEEFQDLDRTQIDARLVPLWGRKLGKADDLARGGRTKEARSSEWVIAALSDLRGRLTARDLVGFVASSADTSAIDDNPVFFDRLLVPKAMTSAIAPVGRQKIDSMGEENPKLKPALDGLRQAPQFAVPITLSEFKDKVSSLTNDQITMLEENGIILIEGDTIEMPEIFRTGLGNVVRKTGGRKSIIGLMNKARQLRSSDTGI
jgi:cellulose biosynthesis protein BcsQ